MLKWISHALKTNRPLRQRTFPRRKRILNQEPLEPRCLLTIGVYEPFSATWFLRGTADSGAVDIPAFSYGGEGWKAVPGDWDGDDLDTVGVFNPDTSGWYLRNSNTAGVPDIASFAFGPTGSIPVVGDWDGDGFDTIGVFDPSSAVWYLRNSNDAGVPDVEPFTYGPAGSIPVVGDWDGDGTDTIGVYDPQNGSWLLRNSNSSGTPDIEPFAYGDPSWQPIAHDWDDSGTDTVGVYSNNTLWYLKNDNTSGPPDLPVFTYGHPHWTALSGNWMLPASNPNANEEMVIDLHGDYAGTPFNTVFTGETLSVPLATESAIILGAPDRYIDEMLVRILNPHDRFDEILLVDSTGTGIDASYDDESNVLKLTGRETAENYTNALRGIRYTNHSLNPHRGARVIEVSIYGDSPRQTGGSANTGESTERIGRTLLTVDIEIGTDTDGDGITDKAELDFYGTSPTVFDSDGDLLPDGIEIRTPGLTPLVTDDAQSDLDNDGLTNLDEVIRGTRLHSRDSDRDGVSDDQEVARRSNPNDPSDLGEAPTDEESVELTLVVGDHSGSHSERYNLIVGDIRHQAQQFGVVNTATYSFTRGQSYPISIVHTGTNLSSPDYDYTAQIQGIDPSQIQIDDPHGILGIHDESSYFYAAGKTATLTVLGPRVLTDFQVGINTSDPAASEIVINLGDQGETAEALVVKIDGRTIDTRNNATGVQSFTFSQADLPYGQSLIEISAVDAVTGKTINRPIVASRHSERVQENDIALTPALFSPTQVILLFNHNTTTSVDRFTYASADEVSGPVVLIRSMSALLSAPYNPVSGVTSIISWSGRAEIKSASGEAVAVRDLPTYSGPSISDPANRSVLNILREDIWAEAGTTVTYSIQGGLVSTAGGTLGLGPYATLFNTTVTATL